MVSEMIFCVFIVAVTACGLMAKRPTASRSTSAAIASAAATRTRRYAAIARIFRLPNAAEAGESGLEHADALLQAEQQEPAKEEESRTGTALLAGQPARIVLLVGLSFLTLLPATSLIRLDGITQETDKIILVAITVHPQATCPVCGHSSVRIYNSKHISCIWYVQKAVAHGHRCPRRSLCC